MYYGGWGHCNMVRLAPDLLRIVPFDDGTLYKEVTPANYTEGPFMLRHRGKYYFMWSEGGWTGPDYCVAYAIADSPFGPFERIGKILEQDPAIAAAPGTTPSYRFRGGTNGTSSTTAARWTKRQPAAVKPASTACISMPRGTSSRSG